MLDDIMADKTRKTSASVTAASVTSASVTAASVTDSAKRSSIRTEALESLAAVRALAERYDCPRLGQALMDTEADHDLHPQCVELHSEGIGGGGQEEETGRQ